MNSALPAPVVTGTKRPTSLETWSAQGAIGSAKAAASTSARTGPRLISASSAKASPNSRYSGRTSALSPIRTPGASPRPPRAAVERPQEGQHGAGHGHLGDRLAQQTAGVEDEGRVGGGQQRGEQPGRRALQPAPEQEADHDRDEAEQRDRQPPERGVHAARDVVDAGVEQRRARRPVVRGVRAGDRELLVGVEQRGDPLVARGVGSLVGGVDRVEDADQPQPEADEQDQAERHEDAALWQRPDAPHGAPILVSGATVCSQRRSFTLRLLPRLTVSSPRPQSTTVRSFEYT